jgi:hypothetical protein
VAVVRGVDLEVAQVLGRGADPAVDLQAAAVQTSRKETLALYLYRCAPVLSEKVPATLAHPDSESMAGRLSNSGPSDLWP